MSTVYLNGEFIPSTEARVSVDDRGFLFADGIYEVSPAYGGRFFRLDKHMERMKRGLAELRIAFDPASLPAVHERLIGDNELDDREVAYVYVQITRGVAPRGHAFPNPPVMPTVYAFAREFKRAPRALWEDGFAAVTVPDRRWARVDVKTIGLLPNVLAQQAAVEAGVADALLVKDGIAIEGAHSNFFAVIGGTLVTHPTSNVILPGITRAFVLELARDLEVPVEERPIQIEELWVADEAFFTGTTTEIRPTVKVDGRVIGKGRPGAVTRLLFEAFLEGVTRPAATAAAR
jgi:D-alanine transaminase